MSLSLPIFICSSLLVALPKLVAQIYTPSDPPVGALVFASAPKTICGPASLLVEVKVAPPPLEST